MSLLPVILVKDDSEGVTISVPDLPGCVTEGSSMEEALAFLQEAVELYLEDTSTFPKFSEFGVLLEHEDVVANKGTLAFVDVDLSFLQRAPQKITVSFPSGLLNKVDRASRIKGMTRSRFLAWAASLAIDKYVML